ELRGKLAETASKQVDKLTIEIVGLLFDRIKGYPPGYRVASLTLASHRRVALALGLPLDRPPFELRPRERTPLIVNGPRVGITKAADKPWRYALAGSPYLSRPIRPLSNGTGLTPPPG
ncbi:MAG: DNA-3-methyladenine glycosylase, partial [Dehalococcoidia bacterium]|nr:DNA-3-methyladenine glycosylase [Dehalococcoidia bacterium]